MWQSAAEFLDSWMSDNVLAESRGPDTIDRSVCDVLRIAGDHGFTVGAITEASGGNLRLYMKTAIELWTGETE
jgi:hypothetical protein